MCNRNCEAIYITKIEYERTFLITYMLNFKAIRHNDNNIVNFSRLGLKSKNQNSIILIFT
jgi:hypothetical protein